MPIYVDKSKCLQDHACPAIGVCPVDALSQEDFNAPKVEANMCMDCGACSSYCPKGALQLK